MPELYGTAMDAEKLESLGISSMCSYYLFRCLNSASETQPFNTTWAQRPKPTQAGLAPGNLAWGLALFLLPREPDLGK